MRCLLLLAAVSLSACTRQPARDTNLRRFERQLLNPAPATVTDVRYDEDLFGDPAYFLAFRCAPADVDRIVREKKFIKGTPSIGSGFRPNWWNLTELGENAVTYNSEAERSVETLWVNGDRNSCYFVFWVI